MSRYEVELEVAGPLAMFARPDTGATPTSFPVPTWSAAKGLFESIAFFSNGEAWFCPTRVEICRPIPREGSPVGAIGRVHFQHYTTNYGGPLRKADQLRKGNSLQVFSTVLSNVCFRLHGKILGVRPSGTANPRHHLQDLFNRRLARGQCHRTPCLGWSEFTCLYWGPPRLDRTEVDDSISMEIPSMLVSMWADPVTQTGRPARYRPRFQQGQRSEAGELLEPLRIEQGVFHYPQPDVLPSGGPNHAE